VEALVSSAETFNGSAVRGVIASNVASEVVGANGHVEFAREGILAAGPGWDLSLGPACRRSQLDVPDPQPRPSHAILPAAAAQQAMRCEQRTRWITGQGEDVVIAGEIFHLSYCFVGPTEDDADNPTVIDARLEIGSKGERPSSGRQHFSAYARFSPAERRAYLEWLSGGRMAATPPRSFLLLFLSSLEHAIVRDGHGEQLADAREQLARLLALHGEDPVVSAVARRLATLCELLDPEFIPSPMFATAETNFREEMPFEVRQFLGWALKSAGRLEADEGLLFYLQQPGRRLEPLVAQYFRELHASWCLRYAHAFGGAFANVALLPKLTLHYQPLHGDFARAVVSDLPDVAALPVLTSLEVLFRECSAPLLQLRHEPVGRVLSNLPVPTLSPELGSSGIPYPRPDAAAHLAALLRGANPQVVQVAQLLGALFEAFDAPVTTLLPKGVADDIARTLDEAGYGFEPDSRSGLPRSLRSDRRITVFRTGCSSYQHPSDQFLLAQAAVVVSGLAQLWYPSIEPLELDEIEQRLPFRHRFAVHEFVRLRATEIAIASLDESPRKFLDRWVKRLARMRRIEDLIGGFGIAFKGQRRNGDLAKLARALVLECQSLVSADDLLAAAADVAIPEERFHRSLQSRVELLQKSLTSTEEGSPTIVAAQEPQACSPARTSSAEPRTPRLDGLDGRHAELLLALHDRARTAPELRELARGRGLTLAGAVDRINEWALLRLGATAVTDDDDFVISETARAFLDQRISQG
jgi:hypothetical protein